MNGHSATLKDHFVAGSTLLLFVFLLPIIALSERFGIITREPGDDSKLMTFSD